MGRRDHADVDLADAARAERAHLALLEHAQQAAPARASGMSPISSRNSVPPSASTNTPGRSEVAPVNAPLLWPNSSLSISDSGIAPQLSATNGVLVRGAALVQRARDQLLAGAALALDQDRDATARRADRALRARGASRPTCRSSASRASRRCACRELAAQAREPRGGVHASTTSSNGAKRLRQVVKCTGTHTRSRGVRACRRRSA